MRTHHPHVVAIGDPQWREWLEFRDELRADEALRARYADLKTDLKERFAGDRTGYTEAKNEFIDSVIHPGGPDRETPMS